MKENIYDLNISTVMSYNKMYNFIISPRGPGKTTIGVLHLWKGFKEKGRPSVIVKRREVAVTAYAIEDVLSVVGKFDKEFSRDLVSYSKSSCKDGVVDVYYDKKLFFRMIGLSKELQTLKGMVIPHIYRILVDEFICNPTTKEKYLPREAFLFKELYNTLQRECDDQFLRVIFLGNPYSLYNPYFSDLNVDTTKLKAGAIVTGKNYVIQCYQLNPLLAAKLKRENPTYDVDDEYTRYAFNGEAINDANIRVLNERPLNYSLKFSVRIESTLLGIWKNNNLLDDKNDFYVEEISGISKRKNIYCFNFTDMLDRTILASREDKFVFNRFKSAFRESKIVFKNIKCYYLIKEVYSQL